MKTLHALLTVLSAAGFLFLGGCALDPDRKLNSAIERYNQKEPGALQTLEEEFIKNVSVDSVKGAHLQSSGTFLYQTHESNAEVVYPSRYSYALTDNEAVTCIDRTSEYAVISDGIKFCIYDGDGDHRNDETIGDKKNRVKAVLLDGDSIIYYKSFKLYRYSIIHNSSEPLLKESFPPPYTNYYKVELSRKDDYLSVMTGIAGSYFFNLIQLSTGSVIVKNLAMSSSRHHWGINTVRYITGNSGNWELMQYALDSKTKKSMARMTDIVDIELAGQGYVLDSAAGLWAAAYGTERTRIPFTYQLAGKYQGRIMLKYRDVHYIIDMKKMLASLRMLTEKASDLFARQK